MDRAVSPAVGVILLVAITVVLAVTVGAALSLPGHETRRLRGSRCRPTPTQRPSYSTTRAVTRST